MNTSPSNDNNKIYKWIAEELDEFLEQQGDHFRRHIRRRLGSKAEEISNDLLHDACYTYLQAVYKESHRFAAYTKRRRLKYFWRTIGNRIRKHYRQDRRRPIILEHEPSAETASPVEQAQHAENIARLYDALAQLPEKTSTFLVQHELEGKSYQTIAREQGRTEAALRRQRCDAIRALRSAFYATGTWGVEDLPPR